jgi:hypothetical protein
MFKTYRIAKGAGWRAGFARGTRVINPYASRNGLFNKWLAFIWEGARLDGLHDSLKLWLEKRSK